jgi:putative spermidine/putrescine transport system permease protein
MAVAAAYSVPARDEQALVIARHVRREQLSIVALTVPALLMVGLFLVLPVAWLFWRSVYDGGFTAENYLRIVQDVTYAWTFQLTFEVSILVTGLTILLGYPLAYFLNGLPRRWAILGLALVIVPFWTSILVRTYAWLVLLQHRGLINKALVDVGAIAHPIPLVHNLTGTIIGMVHVMLPFMVLPLYAAIQRIDPQFMQAAASLGASPRLAFWRVFFPLSWPGVMAGSLLVFVVCLGFYITPELLGGGRVIFVSMLVQRNAELYLRWGAASSVAVVLLLLILVLFWVVNRIVSVERLFGAQ